jgi:hypothetical protein
MNRLTTWLVHRSERVDRMLVARNARLIVRVLVTDLSLLILAWAGLLLFRHGPGPLAIIATLAIALELGRVGIVGLRRAEAYRSGWLDGRSAMLSSLAEAHRRGLTVQEWVQGEMERQMSVLGITPPPPPE